jgi:4-amino-4-deoxy-L-arabinose transferase-like glycosyltransferase
MNFIYKRSKRWWIVLVAIVVVFFSWFPQLLTLNPGISYGDEGLVASSAWRIFNGEVPFRDFFGGLTPGSYYWTAIFFKFLGPTFLSLRISALLTSLIILLCSVWVMERAKIRGSLPCMVVISFLAYFGGPYWFVASHHWISLAWCLISLAFFFCGEEDTDRRWVMLAAGVFAALAACTMQHKGVIWMFAATFALFTLPTMQRKQSLLWFWGGVLAVSIPVVSWFVWKVGFSALFDQLIKFPLTQYHKLEGHQGVVFKELFRNFQNVFSAWGQQSSLLGWVKVLSWNLGYLGRIVVHLLPFAGILALISLWKKATLDRFLLGGLTAFYVSMYLSAIYRPSETTLVYAAPASILAVAAVLESLSHQGLKTTGKALRNVFICGWLFIFAGTAAGFTLTEIYSPRVTTETLVGPIDSLYAKEAQELEGVTNFMKEHRQPGEPVFCYSYLAFFYFLLQAENPTPYDLLAYPMNTQNQLDQAQFLIEQSECRWIIYDFAPLFKNSLGKYFLQNYEMVKRFNDVAILKRKTPFVATPKKAEIH